MKVKLILTFTIIYSINDVTADLEDVYCGIFLSDVGNPVVFSYDSEGRIYYFDELDSEDGAVVNRYEISAELSDEWSYIISIRLLIINLVVI